MKQIELTQGQVALVDDEDYEYLQAYNWYAVKFRTGPFYAHRRNSKTNRPIAMHHDIMGFPPEGLQTDHIDRDGLNNQRCNLRFVDRYINNQNKEFRLGAMGLMGVTAHGKKFRAQITRNGKNHYLGVFRTPEEAAEARNQFEKNWTR